MRTSRTRGCQESCGKQATFRGSANPKPRESIFKRAGKEPISWSGHKEPVIRDEQIKRANDLIEQSRDLAAAAIAALATGDHVEFRRKWHQHEFVDHELGEVITILVDEEDS